MCLLLIVTVCSLFLRFQQRYKFTRATNVCTYQCLKQTYVADCTLETRDRSSKLIGYATQRAAIQLRSSVHTRTYLLTSYEYTFIARKVVICLLFLMNTVAISPRL